MLQRNNQCVTVILLNVMYKVADVLTNRNDDAQRSL